MAYVNPNEIIPGQPQQQVSNAAPITAGGAGLGGATKSPTTPGQNVPAQPSAQLSAYLTANQPQTAAFGQNIANTLGQQTQAAGNAIQPAVNTYTGNLYNVPTDTALNQKIESSPSSLTPEERTAYQKEVGAAGKSPNPSGTFETTAPYQDLTQNINKAVEQAGLWNQGNNTAAISTALQPFEKSGTNAGVTNLDALLLSGSPGAYNQIRQAVAPAAGLQGQLDTGTAQANQALQNSVATNAATTTAAQGSANTYAKNMTDYLNNAVAQSQAKQTALNKENNTLSTDFASGNVTPADIEALNKSFSFLPSGRTAQDFLNFIPGLNNNINYINSALDSVNSNSGQPLYGSQYKIPTLSALNSNYLLPGMSAPAITNANTATGQNYSDVAALMEMLGGNAPTLPIDASTADQAGTSSIGTPAEFNQNTLLSQLGPVGAGYANIANSPLINSPNTDIGALRNDNAALLQYLRENQI